ncbi:MFS transporter [Gammaproteobacteria bacterium LSUCC0057]|uniref:MFS transporter n=1 Tax=Gammaproteobacteria bacterium LSUCC0057 TaxID=2559237 RepID=A0A4Y8UJ64_9GAMM|nr:MFS transporter [Gammaproteobacteria bacterium LSUCC0057]
MALLAQARPAVSALRFWFNRYLGGVACAQLAMGIHAVIYPWLVVGVLQESPSRLGSALMAVFLPNLLFTLVGGAMAESRHGGRWLAQLYALYLLPLLLLLAVLFGDQLSYPLLLGYGLLYGTITAFVQPAREALLGHVPTSGVHRAVARTAVVQSALQGGGFVLAGYFEFFGLNALLLFQALLIAASALLFASSLTGAETPVAPPQSLPSKRMATVVNSWRDIVEGWQRTRQVAVLRDTVLVVLATGVLVFGIYLVGLPLLADHYQAGSAALFGYFQLTFTGGMFTANLLLARRHASALRAGRMLVSGLALRGFLLLALALEPPLWLVFPLIFGWGCSSGLSMTQGRTLIHQFAPSEVRSRVVSIYQLCLFGGAPIGAWLSGAMIEQLSLPTALAVYAVLSILVALPFVTFSPLWRLARGAQPSA